MNRRLAPTQKVLLAFLLLSGTWLGPHHQLSKPAQTPAQSAPVKSTESSRPVAAINPASAKPASIVNPQRPSIPGAQQGRPWEDIPNWQELTPRARLLTLLKAPFGLSDRGTVRVLELAKDQLHLRHLENPHQRVVSIPSQTDVEGVLREAEAIAAQTGSMPQLVFYPPGVSARTATNRRILSDQVLMQSAQADAVVATATHAGLQDPKPMSAAPGYILAKDDRFPGAALIAAADMASAPGITDSRPMLGMQMVKRMTPTDPLFASQWHLKQTNGIHVNASTVWDTNQGSSIKVAVIDDGLQLAHPDLSANADTSVPTLHKDYVGGDTDPTPFAPADDPATKLVDEAENGDNHGTAVAGLIAARANNGKGGVGVAPEAKLVGLRLLSDSQTPADEADAFGHRNDVIQIKNNSWGPPDGIPWVLGVADPVVLTALENAASTGRGGLGTIVTFAAGNGREDDDQSNKDAYANNLHTFAIGALTKTGVPASYSEYGANLIACAPADGVTTTDLMGLSGYNPGYDLTDLTDKDYSDEFNGTSAACPVASGVIALMLQANPNLGWRDVMEILLRTGKKVGATDPEWVTRSGGFNGIAPIKHNPKYGGGMVDALAATTMASTWLRLPTRDTLSKIVTGNTAILENNATGITKNFDFSSETPTRVEQVEVTVDISHTYRGDLTIQLVSPSGTVSNLATLSRADGGEEAEDPYGRDVLPKAERGYHGWTFTSMRHWGEGSVGTWRLVIADRSAVDTGTFHSATIKLHGVSAPPVQITTQPLGQWAAIGSSASFSVLTDGFADITHQWRKGTTTVATTTDISYTIPIVNSTHAANYSVLVSNVTGSELSNTVPLGVYTTAPAALTVNVTKPLTLTAAAIAPVGTVISYRWRKNGIDLTDDPLPASTQRILGTRTKTLTVKNMQAADADTYDCVVAMGSLEQSTGNTVVSVRLKPDIQTNAFPTDLIVSSAALNLPLTIANGSTSVVISGLPSGMIYNKTTGVISGIPNVPMANKPITVTATNLAGTTTKTINLTVAALDPDVVGTFNGLVTRNPEVQANSNYGGYLSNLKVASTGAITGVLKHKQLAHAISGRLIATATNDPGTTLIIKRTGLPDAQLTFTIDRGNGKLTGTLSQALAPVWTADVEAWRNPYDAAHLATTLAGIHNFWMDPPVGTPFAKPQGAGNGSATISTLGVVSLVYHLADGTLLTQSTTIGSLGHIPLHAMLYANKGAINGWLTITDAALPGYNTIGGTVQWNKTGPTTTTDRTYASGFDFGVLNASLLSVTGSEWRKPPTLPPPPVILWGIPDVAADQVNAALTFAGGLIENAALFFDANKQFRISTQQRVTIPLPNNATVVLSSLSTSNGAFSGTVTLKDALPAVLRKFSYTGVISLHHQQGRGYFLLPGIPTTAAPILSGAVQLNEVP